MKLKLQLYKKIKNTILQRFKKSDHDKLLSTLNQGKNYKFHNNIRTL